jgi:CBS domain-containing protein
MHARDIMTKSVVTVLPSASLKQAAGTLSYRGFTALPVTTEDGELLGIITEADVMRSRFGSAGPARPEEHQERAPELTVADAMTSPVVGVSHDTDVSIVADEMLNNRRRFFPVVDGTRLVGVITRRDIVRVLARTDSEIADDVRHRLAVIGGQSRWSVDVDDGDVTVQDMYSNASDHEVAKVLTESAPGVIRARIVGRGDPGAE